MARIILIGSAYPFRGGLATFNERLCRELLSEGHEVEIYTFTIQYPSFLFPGKTQFSDTQPPSGLKISRRINSMNPLNWIWMGNKIRAKKPDILLFKYWLPFMGPCFGTVARIAKKNRFTKVISILDNVIPHEARTGDAAFTKYFLHSCDGCIAMSDVVMRDLKIMIGDKPALQSPHPLYDNFGPTMQREEAIHQLGLDPKFRYLLFFGFIRNYKGLDLAIHAMADTRLKVLPLKLIVAGEFYEDPEPYLELIARLSLSERIVLRTDFIADDDVKKYFSAVDLLVQPYKTSTQSGVTQIAFHFNRPVIVTKTGGLPEFVHDGKTGFCVDTNPEAIAEAILKFYRYDLGESMQSFIENEKKNYSWKSFAGAIMNLFDSLHRPPRLAD